MSALGRRRQLALALAAALVLGGGLIGLSRLGADEPQAAPALAEPSALAGVPQDGITLGSPTAPVTLVEYADLQCPYCAEWARGTLPALLDSYVRPGKVRIVFRGLAFLGPDSDRALRAALAAARQDRLWNVVDALYRRQGPENSGWVTESLLEEVAGADALAQRGDAWVDGEIAAAAVAARAAGIPGTPSFQVGPTGGRLQLVQLRSLGLEGLQPAIEAALRS